MIRSLEAGASIARYRVVSLLGAGGMGEVYLARDESLDRSVALKILPPDLVKNDERVRRFVQEAKSASSLNHPHIVTIYEIGQADIGGAGGTAETIHFIAMELVSGATLKTLIHQEKIDLKTLVRHLAQAADGLAKAHAAGIVHRDLKPENIMVTSDGFAKVVDFGLAKLTETTAGGTEVTSAPTEHVRRTGAGVVLGTVGYMSPEQVQGKTVDHRSDIFSLGCVLYEAATRQRPFQADSDVETLHKILKEKPPAIEELNPEVPGELRRIIRRCLAKSVDQRAQGMKDLALELAEIADEYDTLTASSGSGTRASSGVMGAAPTNWRTQTLIVAAFAVGVLGLSAAAWSVWRGRTASSEISTPLERMTVTRLMSSSIGGVLLSPDGRQLVYTKSQAGRVTLWMRQIATGSDIQIPVTPAPQRLVPASFSADGNYLYFTGSDEVDIADPMDLYQVPALGGNARRLAGPFAYVHGLTVSPDGRRMAWFRYSLSSMPAGALVVANIDGSGERTLVTYDFGVDSIAWSPDGEALAVASDVESDGRMLTTLTAIAVADGRATAIGSTRWESVRSLAWLGDGRDLVMTATAATTATDDRQELPQIWVVAYPDGQARRVTNDANNYSDLTVSADGTALVTTQTRSRWTGWMAQAGTLSARTEVSIGVEHEPVSGGFAASDATGGSDLLFSLRKGNEWAIWIMREDGTGARPLTPDSLSALFPAVSVRAGVVVFQAASQDSDIYHLWRMDINGSNLRQITSGDGEYFRALSPDGSFVLFLRRGDRAIWRMPVAGGEATKFLDATVDFPRYSPDGQRLLIVQRRQEDGRERSVLAVIPASGGSALQSWDPPPDSSRFAWAPEGNAVDFRWCLEGVCNVWRMPIGGGTPRQLTMLTTESVSSFMWIANGARLFYDVRDTVSRDVLMIKNFRPDENVP